MKSFNKPIKLLVAGAALVTIGLCVLAGVRAAGTTASVQTESGTVNTPASSIADSSASAGQAVKFGSAVTGGARTCPAYPLFPDSTCTGVPAGTSLTTINGNYTTTSNGQHIDGKLIQGDLIVNNDNVVVTNTRIVGLITNNSSGLSLTDSDVGLNSCLATAYENGNYSNLAGSNYTLTRTHIHNAGADLIGIGGTGTILIQDSILDQACYYAGDHLDAAQFYAPGAVGHVTFEHSVLNGDPVNSSVHGNSAIFWADTPGNGSTLEVNHSSLAGGGYTVALYDAVVGSHIVLTVENSTFVAGSWQYYYCASSNSVQYNGQEGVRFLNNVSSTGAALSGC